MNRNWTFCSLPRTPQDAIAMAHRCGLLSSSQFCPIHRIEMKFYDDRDHGRFRCPKIGCNKSVSAAIGTLFEETRTPVHIAVGLMYSFTRDLSYEDARHETCDVSSEVDPRTQIPQETITTWYRYCREMVVDHFTNIQQNLTAIGGPGVVIRLDEVLFGHREPSQGRFLEGHWVIGMIETISGNVRMVVVDEINLAEEIAKCVLPGSEIHTDSWKAYDGLSSLPECNYVHKKVYRSDPELRNVGGTNWR